MSKTELQLPAPLALKAWSAPKLTCHGTVQQLTQFPKCPDGRPDPSGVGLPEYCGMS